jgi:tetratricopeptide (TPR) repeat protein
MRGAALGAVRDRIARAAETQDVDVLLAEQSLLEAAIVAAATDLRQDIEAARVLGSLLWNRYLARPEGAGQDDFAAAVELFTPVFQADPAAVPDQLRDACQRADNGLPADDGGLDAWDEQAVALVIAYERSGNAGPLIKAMTLFRASLQATPPGDPRRPRRLSNFGLGLLTLFERTGQEPILAEAIQIARQAAAITPEDHPDRPGVLSNLGFELRLLYERTGQLTVLEEAVRVGREAVAATPDDSAERAGVVSNLGLVLRLLFSRIGHQAALEGVHIFDRRECFSIRPEASLFARVPSIRGLTGTAYCD